jgi:RNA polymerase sigma factor (sigma-70 family)
VTDGVDSASARRRERALVVAAEAGDSAAGRELVELFGPAIAGLARRFPTGAGVERQELMQAGVAGLLFAARRFDVRRDTPFWAYASFWVRKAMQDLVAELTRPIVLSDRAARGLAEINRARLDHLRRHLTEPTDDQLSAATGLTRAQIESLRAAARSPHAIDEPLARGDGRAGTIGDLLVDPAAERAYDEVLDRIEIRLIRDSLDQLDDRERTVVRSHYGLGQPARTLTDIGDSLGVTGERARQIEAGALRKLRAALAQPAPLSDGAA